ncbi:hypothetical protein CLV30_106167 [Haloactinopolyspora alba]|uniref:Calcineurin-like phosphoesterase family protein n=1 Tax=Haloactinopolyspora alba TaxID=648780 RepID=A0A2P8E3W7_9ACTN|nr:hypothetical protein [Haloactinopolyspora alba]PSL04162.1 hypothetical protein CLV30_106167 [Haloactinopolyspora alba]
MSELTEKLKAAPPAPASRRAPQAVFSSRVDINSLKGEAEVELNDEPGVVTEGTALEFLEKEGQDPSLWEVVSLRRSEWDSPGGNRLEATRVSFRRRERAAEHDLMPDLDDLHAAVERAVAADAWIDPDFGIPQVTNVAVIADPQAGKVDHRGGTSELLQRLEMSLARWAAYVQEQQPEEIILADAGDAIENFESVGSQDRTNDLQLTEQIRVWRRVFWKWIDTAAQLAPSVKVLSVGSNHCRVRRGKSEMGTTLDDFGIEVLSQVMDMAEVYPERYGHVEFYAPDQHSESVAVEAVGGRVLGLAHGHQVRNPDQLGKWLAGQALGRTPIGSADIAVFGHFHNLRVQTVGDDRWLFIAPTSDNGSSWFRNLSGAESAPGVMSVTLDSDGWRDLVIV